MKNKSFLSKLYRNNSKNREFDKEVPQNFGLERETIAERQGASENKKSEGKPTSSKPDSSSCFGIKPASEKTPVNPEMELRMLPRLKAVGYILIFFSLIAFSYAFFVPRENPLSPLDREVASIESELYSGMNLSDEIPLELTPQEVLNFYVVSAIFASIGLSTFFIVRKKRKTYTM